MFNYEYVGNLHIHSKYSDGGGGISDIVGAAARVGLDFICINDHGYMADDLHMEEEGFYDGVLVLVGLEMGKRYHHYLAYDLKSIIRDDNLTPQEMIDEVNKQGFGFMAHPFEKGMPFSEKSVAYTWNDLSVAGHTGICIWNFSSRWKERIKSPLHALYCLAFKRETLKGPSKKTLSFWDDQCRKGNVVAIGGSDAHGSLFKWGPITIKPLSYDYLLSTINIHILLNKPLLKDFEEAKKQVYAAMRAGRLFVAHDKLCPARGFKFDFVSEDGSNSFMGEAGKFTKGELFIEVPHEGEIRLIKDGNLHRQWRGTEAVYRVKEPGAYRVEVYRRLALFGWKPWIFSNPIYLR